ncbi:helix-turn-helix domain-containing protein, partial [Actinomadura sp. CNU-125]|uniref:helix-turn-helix domain-containing protein n=1 Tax=Actinomadura sp. CNU-125 TaxID=1904961 RepID=UPI000AB8E048
MDGWIDAAEAAERLGVKPATLYSYVSRGVLRRRRDPGAAAACSTPRRVRNWPAAAVPAARPAPASSPSSPAITALGP